MTVTVTATAAGRQGEDVQGHSCASTRPIEADYYRHGGILQYVLRQLGNMTAKKAAPAAGAAPESRVPAVELPHRVAILSFEGPDRYASIGGLGTRVTQMANALEANGNVVDLIFVGDPASAPVETRGQRDLAPLVAMDLRAPSAQRLRRRKGKDRRLGIEPAGVRRRSDRRADGGVGRTDAGDLRGVADGRRRGRDRPAGAAARRAQHVHADLERQQHLRLGTRRFRSAARRRGDYGRQQVHEVRARALRRAVARDSRTASKTGCSAAPIRSCSPR